MAFPQGFSAFKMPQQKELRLKVTPIADKEYCQIIK
jgi:hypothetical protein